jgi:hypothetical protein
MSNENRRRQHDGSSKNSTPKMSTTDSLEAGLVIVL